MICELQVSTGGSRNCVGIEPVQIYYILKLVLNFLTFKRSINFRNDCVGQMAMVTQLYHAW